MLLKEIAQQICIPDELGNVWEVLLSAMATEVLRPVNLWHLMDDRRYVHGAFQLIELDQQQVEVRLKHDYAVGDKDALWQLLGALRGRYYAELLAAQGTGLADYVTKKLMSKLGREQERELLFLLQEVPAVQLQELFHQLPLSQLFSAFDDHWMGEKNQRRFIELLGIDRLTDLDIERRFQLISVLHSRRMGHFHQRAVHGIFLGTEGEDLQALKARLERTGSYKNLHHLVFQSFEDQVLQEEILLHFAQQAEKIEASSPKILSDIDDTIYVNWKDEKYPKKTPYPGMRVFYQHLDGGQNGSPRGDLTFVTARPRDRGGISQNMTLRSLKKLGFEDVNLLAGRWHKIHSSKAIMEGKWKNFQQYRKLHPERDFVFIGDSGQLDVEFACRLRDSGTLRLALIHRVVPQRSTAWEQRYGKSGIYFFDTFVGAARYALEDGLLNKAAALAVLHAAKQELGSLRCKQKATRIAALAADEKALLTSIAEQS